MPRSRTTYAAVNALNDKVRVTFCDEVPEFISRELVCRRSGVGCRSEASRFVDLIVIEECVEVLGEFSCMKRVRLVSQVEVLVCLNINQVPVIGPIHRASILVDGREHAISVDLCDQPVSVDSGRRAITVGGGRGSGGVIVGALSYADSVHRHLGGSRSNGPTVDRDCCGDACRRHGSYYGENR